MDCDYCEKQAKANYQKAWVRWTILKNGNYAHAPNYVNSSIGKLNEWQEPTGKDNLHLCEEHEEELLSGGLEYGE